MEITLGSPWSPGCSSLFIARHCPGVIGCRPERVCDGFHPFDAFHRLGRIIGSSAPQQKKNKRMASLEVVLVMQPTDSKESEASRLHGHFVKSMFPYERQGLLQYQAHPCIGYTHASFRMSIPWCKMFEMITLVGLLMLTHHDTNAIFVE